MAQNPSNNSNSRVNEGKINDSESVDAEGSTYVNSSTIHSPTVFSGQQQFDNSPLHAPRFPVSLENRDTSNVSIDALSFNGSGNGADMTTINMTKCYNSGSISSKAAPVRSLPSSSYFSGHGADPTVPKNGRTNTTEQNGSSSAAAIAAEAGVSAATPPADDDDTWYQEQLNYVRNQVQQMENTEILRDAEANAIRSKWKRELFLLFEDPSSSPSAFVLNLFITFMIIFSAVLTTIETIPSLRKGNTKMWFGLETTIVAVFTLEFILRFLGHTDTWKQTWKYAKSLVTIVDALAIFPYYFELAFHRDTTYEFRFTILRIFRLLRVFSAFKYSSLLQLSIEVMIVAIKRSSDALLAFLLFVTLTVLLFSTLMYFAERGTWDDERQAFLNSNGEYSLFSSIPAAAYYSIVTLTTTGFGDMVPTTFIGKLISFPMMISGILLIALPSIIVGRNFTQVWEAARKYRVHRPDAVQMQRYGETLIDPEAGDNHQGSERHSLRRRRRKRKHRQNHHNDYQDERREGSISSFDSGPESHPKSPFETAAGGYTTVYAGGSKNTVNEDNDDYTIRTDPIDDLVRKDSFEMQEFVSGPIPPKEYPGGYTQVVPELGDTERSDDGSSGSGSDRYAECPRRSRQGSSSFPRHSRDKGKESDVSSIRRRAAGSRRSHYSDSRLRRNRTHRRHTHGSGYSSNDKVLSPSDNDEFIRISRSQWNAMNAMLSELHGAVFFNQEILQRLAQNLSVPNTTSTQTAVKEHE